MQTKLNLLAVIALAALSANAQESRSAEYEYITLDAPNSLASFPLGINYSRSIAGYFIDFQGVTHGYLYKAGKFTTIDHPDAIQVPGAGTTAGGINDRGDIAGLFFGKDGFQHGYIRTLPAGCDDDADDKITCKPMFKTLDVPGAGHPAGVPFEFGPGLGTAAIGINNWQQVVGMYAAPAPAAYSLGFVETMGAYKTIEDPFAGHTPGAGTKLFAINDVGVIAGDYLTPGGVTHGFLNFAKEFTPIFVPNSDKGGLGTQVNGLNLFGEAVGVFTDPMGKGHALLWVAGHYFTVDFANKAGSEAHSINARGDITGEYANNPQLTDNHGFVAFHK